MKRLVDVTNISHEEWLKYRKMGITGTDTGAIVGMNPYKSALQVFVDKTTDNIEVFDNEAMKQGRDLEEYVAQRFCHATGKKVRRANAIFSSDEYPWMLADFDRLVAGEKTGLECKTVSPILLINGRTEQFHYTISCRFSIISRSVDMMHGILRRSSLEKNLLYIKSNVTKN